MSRHALSLLLAFVFTITACKKDTPHSGQNNGTGPLSSYFFANTEWAGYAETYGQEHPQAMYMHIYDDSSVVVYALFNWLVGNDYITADSLVGKITSIDTVTYGPTTIYVNYPLTNDQTRYHFYPDTTLKGGSLNSMAPASQQFTPYLSICREKAPDVQGKWTTSLLDSSNVNPPLVHQYPDLADVFFNGGSTYYERGGQPARGPVPGGDISIGYKQEGRRVSFYGYNEQKSELIPYFGVILADGMVMFCDVRDQPDARLPNYIDTYQHYGPNGSVPVMFRE